MAIAAEFAPSAARSGEGAFYAEIDISAGLMNAPMTVWLTGAVAY